MYKRTAVIGPCLSKGDFIRVVKELGGNLEPHMWDVYKSETSVHDRGTSCANVTWSRANNYTVISVEAFLNKKERTMQSKYKLGDKIDIETGIKKISEGRHPEYKNGDLFVVLTEDDADDKGTVIELHNNDGTRNPYFHNVNGADRVYYWHNLGELPTTRTVVATKVEKPTVVEAQTIYSDGVQVSENELRFDGEVFTRENLTARVRRYQEVLRRPVASVEKPAPKKAVKKAASKTPAKAPAKKETK